MQMRLYCRSTWRWTTTVAAKTGRRTANLTNTKLRALTWKAQSVSRRKMTKTAIASRRLWIVCPWAHHYEEPLVAGMCANLCRYLWEAVS